MKTILEGTIALILAVLSCMIMINVVLRYSFSSSILSVDELSRYLFVWLTFLGVIIISIENSHIRVGFVIEKLSPRHQRRIQIISHFIIFLLCLLLAIGSWQKTLQDWNNHSPILGLPVGIMYMACLPASIIIGTLELYRLWLLFKNPVSKNNKEKKS